MSLPLKCTGCMACYNSCKFNAISIETNEKGFYVPKIDKSKCKNCNMCTMKCPEINKIKKNSFQKCYAGWSCNEKTRLNSTSGGIFFELALYVIENGGVVVGAVFENNKVSHQIITLKNDLKKLQGSKYVQSYIGKIYVDVEKILKSGKTVLFSGVGCQVSALKQFLGKEYNNLITVDVLCHGAPSPKIFEDYLKSKNIDHIKRINFRYKRPGWNVFSMKINYDDKKTYVKDVCSDEYLRLFLSDFITNEVCGGCKYVGKDRISDITLADFWGYVSETRKKRNDEKGISLILTNTDCGEELINKISDKLFIFEKDFIEAKNGNMCLQKPYGKNKFYEDFWIDYKKHGYGYCIKKYYYSKSFSFKRKLSLFINDHAYLIPKFIRKKMYRYKYTRKGV